MREPIKLRILDDAGLSLFNGEARYIVPLYQRAYAWEDKEILQMIHDIYDMEPTEDTQYHLGSLIVSQNADGYEVIDGQQRLTTLFIILKCLWKKGALSQPVHNTLSFACREKSDYTLQNLFQLDDNRGIEETICVGRDVVLDELNKKDFSVERFVGRLKKVVLYQIEVPEHTDLNRYFEIMNTRGEQLEQHDIVKANLMHCLTLEEQPAFAAIWNACSDMDGYVQMNFPKTDANTKGLREALFGKEWGTMPDFESLIGLCEAEEKKHMTIHEILQEDFDLSPIPEENLDRVRFESIIDFPYFLLHVLRVFVETRNITGVQEERLLDDKKLTKTFANVMENGTMNRDQFAREFIKFLLQCRFLFDKYIVKREYRNENAEGEWSLQELKVSKSQKQKRAYYTETEFKSKWKHRASAEDKTKNILMLQSCFRVSYTSPKIMHWITKLLSWLCQDGFANLDKLGEFEEVNEEIARTEVKTNFLEPCNGIYDKGVDTPHLVFNYLDYLLWKQTREDFKFEFRNSVEHWYPQRPADVEQWGNHQGLDNFGNLCIIQRNVNSRFSNMMPEAKKSTYPNAVGKGSLKLRRMAALTVGQDGQTANERWRQGLYLQHEQEMITLLRTACGME